MTLRERLMLPLAAALIVGWLAGLAGALISDKLPVFVVCNTPFGVLVYWVFRGSKEDDKP